MNQAPNPIDLQKHLRGVDYPAGRDDLVSAARRTGADEVVLDALAALPDRRYETPADVTGEVFEEG